MSPPLEESPRPSWRKPASMWRAFQEDLQRTHRGPAWTRQDVLLFLCAIALLALYDNYARPRFFRNTLMGEVSQWLSMGRGHPYRALLPYFYWANMSALLRIFLPCLFIWVVLKDTVGHYGYRLRISGGYAKIYLALFVGMLPLVYLASLTQGFQESYPFYKKAALGWDHFLLYQLGYGVQLMAVEAFFRGFLTFALFKRFGYYSLLIVTIPYCMIHFGKPLPETLGSILAGLGLGYLALKSKSWVYGGLLHWSVAFTMDLLAILHKGGFKG